MRKNGLGYRPSPHDPRDARFGSLMRAGAVPPRSDGLRGFIGGLTDQEDAEGCVGWSLSGCLWTRWNYLSAMQGRVEPVVRPSAIFPWWTARQLIGNQNSNDGTYMRDAIKQTVKVGIPPESVWRSNPPSENVDQSGAPSDDGVPRFAQQPSVSAFQHAADQRFPLGYSRVGVQTSERRGQFSQALSSFYPIQIGTQVTTAFLNLGPHAPLPPPSSTDEIAGGHALQVVCYDELGVYGPNTWQDEAQGILWGNDGWFALSWEYVLWQYTEDCWAIDAALPAAWPMAVAA